MKKIFNKNNIWLYFILSRLILLVIILIKKDLSILNMYDGANYIEIAKNGYSSQELYAFFPLYPLLIRLVHYIIPSYKISGFLISNISVLLSIIIFNKLVKDKENIICFIFSPILIYTSIVYTESLFMLLTLFGYYLYKKDKYLLSGVIVGLSILTRNSGIILWGAIGIDMLYRLFKKKDIKLKNIIQFGLISLLIGLIYPVYLYCNTGDFLMFSTVQVTKWHRVLSNPFIEIINDIKVVIHVKDFIYTLLLNWISYFFVFYLGIKLIKKDIVSSIYIIVSLIAFGLTYRDITYWSSLSSISLFRYVFNLFPIYLNISKSKVITFMFIIIAIFNTIAMSLGIFIG